MTSSCFIALIVGIHILFQSGMPLSNSVEKQGMKVAWQHDAAYAIFELEAPTQGWLAIGFTETPAITGAYLLMARVVGGKTEGVEHYTLHPGDYRPLTELGVPAQLTVLGGEEQSGKTRVRFRVPTEAQHKYARSLSKGQAYILHMAFSREDDFQHHSMMRTFVSIRL